MLHEPAVELGTDKAAAKKARLGVILFLFYALIYAGFVIIGVAYPEKMGDRLIGGQNIAVVYGIGLIVLAIVMGFIYNFFCSRMEDKLNGTHNSKTPKP